MKFRPLFIIFVLICLLGSGCGQAVPATTTAPTIPFEPTLPATLTLRIRLSTDSDWTELFLVSGATWSGYTLVSRGEGAITAALQEDHLVLDQPISRADAGKSTEMTIEATFADWQSGEPITFKILRGNIGSTRVEFYRPVGKEWVMAKSVDWGGITGDGQNAHTLEVSLEELLGVVVPPTASPQERTAVAVDPVTGMPQGTDGYPWWNDSAFYEIYVRSFYDSNGDGIGDLKGIIEKLDYLNDGDPSTTSDLGVTGIWLMPIYPSQTNHGYNVTDYYNVKSDYGTLDDLKNLLEAAHARGIRVILDISLGQTSYLHPWFIQAQDPSSPYHDWYVWSNVDPGYVGSWGQEVWFPLNGIYYYGTFSAYSPDLNQKNPEVVAETQKIVRFWLQDVGVDGFRLDSAKHIIEEGTIQANSASTHAWWKNLLPLFKQYNPQSMTVAEIWDDAAITSKYLQGDEMDLAFDFYLATLILQSVNEGNSVAAKEQLERSYSAVPTLKFAPFLSNHDQDRLATQLGNDLQKMKVAAAIMMTSPGTPFIYYGEEVGLEGQVPNDANRAPMQWSADSYAGFSTASPWEPLGPDWRNFNVANEESDPSSLLNYYRALIRIHNEHAALRVGDLSILDTENDALYSILRVSKEEAVLVLVNLTGRTITDYTLAVDNSSLAKGTYMPVAILGNGEFAPLTTDSSGGFSQVVPIAKIPPYGTFILQLQLQTP